MKTAGRMLGLGWMVLAVGVALSFSFPKGTATVLHPIRSYFPFLPIIPLVLLIGTVCYFVVRASRSRPEK